MWIRSSVICRIVSKLVVATVAEQISRACKSGLSRHSLHVGCPLTPCLVDAMGFGTNANGTVLRASYHRSCRHQQTMSKGGAWAWAWGRSGQT